MASTRIHSISTFARLNYFGFTSSIALAGVCASDPAASGLTLACVVIVAAAFHVFAYVQNDVFDLEIDRTQPLRQHDPLVTGQITPQFASFIAHVQIPVALIAIWLCGGGFDAAIAILVAFSLMTIYNAFGKKFAVPMVTDAVQGVSWGALAFFGSAMTGQSLSPLVWIAGAFGFSFIFLINGVHGGLRDLRNDKALGCRTTAIYLGAREDGDAVTSTLALQVFAFSALLVHIVPGSIGLTLGYFEYSGLVFGLVAAAWTAVNALNVLLLWPIVRIHEPRRHENIRRHGLPLLGAPLILFLPRMGPMLQATTLVCFAAPFLLFDTQLKLRIRKKVHSWLPRKPSAVADTEVER